MRGLKMSEDRAAVFRQKAAECSLKASKTRDEAERAAWLLVANAWLTLARSDEQRADSMRALDEVKLPVHSRTQDHIVQRVPPQRAISSVHPPAVDAASFFTPLEFEQTLSSHRGGGVEK
jgi:hypothetical protein